MLAPAEVSGLVELVQSLCLLAVTCGVAGGMLYMMVSRGLSALWDHLSDARYKAYQKASNRG